jgi:hypothetical protein
LAAAAAVTAAGILPDIEATVANKPTIFVVLLLLLLLLLLLQACQMSRQLLPTSPPRTASTLQCWHLLQAWLHPTHSW